MSRRCLVVNFNGPIHPKPKPRHNAGSQLPLDVRLTRYTCPCGNAVNLTGSDPLPSGWRVVQTGRLVEYRCPECAP